MLTRQRNKEVKNYHGTDLKIKEKLKTIDILTNKVNELRKLTVRRERQTSKFDEMLSLR